MAVVTLTDIEAELQLAVGTERLLQGRRLREAGAVMALVGNDGRLTGTVSSREEKHQLDVVVRWSADGGIDGFEGWCSCGRAVPCAGTVALMLGAPDGKRVRAEQVGAAAARAASPVVVRERPSDAWAKALDRALAPPDPVTGRASQAQQPRRIGARSTREIGLQFELTQVPGALVQLRPVVVGASGAWVRSGVSWDLLGYGDYYTRGMPPRHVQLLRELTALPSSLPRGYHDRSVVLDAVASRRVWDLLLEAQEQGLPMVMTGRRGEPVQVHPEPALPVVDVSADHEGHEGLTVRAHLAVAGRSLDGYVQLGSPPHGVAWPGDGPGGGLQLARLAMVPPPAHVALARAGGLRIPAEGVQRFVGEYVPALLEQVEVVSRDGTFEVPQPQPPVLCLTVTGRGTHVVELAWHWQYARGGGVRSEPFVADPVRPAAGRQRSERDGAAEARLLDVVTSCLAEHPETLTVEHGMPRPRASAVLSGLATARFMADAIPELQACAGVEVQLDLQPEAPGYQEVDATPVIEFHPAEGSGAAGPTASQDWFDLAVTVTMEGEEVPFQQLFVALAQEQSHLVLDDGRYFSLDRPEFAQLAALIAESRALLDAPPSTVRLNRFSAGLWEDVERLGEIRGQVDGWRDAVKALTTATLSTAALPATCAPPDGLAATLRPYQQVGFSWLAGLVGLGLGGILADDMGLGKAVQALALLLHAREQRPDDRRPFLVVAPTSVVANWATEAARFAPSLSVATITATGRRRGHDVATAVAGADVVITSYTLFRLEFDEYRELPWAVLLLDEAQHLKNCTSAGYLCARRLPADAKIAITGTPMENNLLELWSLLSITAPGLFPRQDRFTEYYRLPIERERDGERLAQLRRRIRPLMLRRTKGEVAADLPDRQEQTLELELHPRHRAAYTKYLQRERQKVLGLLGDLQNHRFEILKSLTLLRQASLDLSLVDAALAGIPSTKLDALVEQLEHVVAEGHRVLVFSQFTRFLGLARARLDAAGIDYAYLDGTTRKRSAVIDTFRTGDVPVFLLSLKAGGVGLNLTEADYVVLLDPWWNPATEAQAVDRAHRIGQTRKVMVYRMVAKGTIEEKVVALKDRKAALTASVLDEGDFSSGALTPEDIRWLLA